MGVDARAVRRIAPGVLDGCVTQSMLLLERYRGEQLVGILQADLVAVHVNEIEHISAGFSVAVHHAIML